MNRRLAFSTLTKSRSIVGLTPRCASTHKSAAVGPSARLMQFRGNPPNCSRISSRKLLTVTLGAFAPKPSLTLSSCRWPYRGGVSPPVKHPFIYFTVLCRELSLDHPTESDELFHRRVAVNLFHFWRRQHCMFPMKKDPPLKNAGPE